jgi:UDP-N-acetylmuramoylalanine--D-glutamate ligase
LYRIQFISSVFRKNPNDDKSTFSIISNSKSAVKGFLAEFLIYSPLSLEISLFCSFSLPNLLAVSFFTRNFAVLYTDLLVTLPSSFQQTVWMRPFSLDIPVLWEYNKVIFYRINDIFKERYTMNDKLNSFYKSLHNKKVSFIGLGRSHRELLPMFASKGAIVTLRDKRTREQIGEEADKLEALGIKLTLGENYLENLCKEDIILRTPGMNYFTPALQQARKSGAFVTSEMELFFDLCPCKIYAVTGSDGKTTTTTVISEFLKAQGFSVFLGGNIGFPLLPRIEQIGPDDRAVVELSSFQLISMRKSPDVAVITNVAPNHLDVHKDMQEYIDAKRNIYLHQGGISRTVINADNEITASFLPEIRGEAMQFSRRITPDLGCYLAEDGTLTMNDRHSVTPVLHMDEIRIPGIHNVENYLAAISAVWGEVSKENIVSVAKNFGGVEHRIEFVRELDGVTWYNDSIASSPTRTIAGLNSFKQKLILIAGGYDKKIPFEPLAPKIIEKVKVLILMGVTAPKIEAAVTACEGYDPDQLTILHVSSMQEAVQKAREVAEKGDIVSLSPACASFDLYPDFEARGRHFKELVNALQ